MKRLKVMEIICAGIMALVMTASMTGCGNDSSSVSKKADSSSSKSDSKDKNDKKTDENKDEEKSEESVEKTEEATMSAEEFDEYNKSDEHKEFIQSEAAGQLALDVATTEHGQGDWRIINVEKGTYEDQECWNISVKDENNTESNGYMYAVGNDFCMQLYEINH